MTYIILLNPGHNRVYFETARRLSLAEFAIASAGFGVACENAREESFGGAPCLVFDAAGTLSPDEMRAVMGLSFTYALFAGETINGTMCLRPVDVPREDFVDEGVSAILKYTGKTNELFTRMLVNIALYTQDRRENLRLLDPVSGKGTTLYEGLIKGFHVYGMEIGEKVTQEAVAFTKRYFENARYKFDFHSERLSGVGAGKPFTMRRNTFAVARTKEAYKEKDTRTIEFVEGNSQFANKAYKKGFFDMVVGDLPYGVQHGNVTNEKQSGLTRNPSALLAACLPAWAEVLRPGGVLVLAWNTNVLSRAKMVALLSANGLTVCEGAADLALAHRVDQAITRDVVAAVKE